MFSGRKAMPHTIPLPISLTSSRIYTTLPLNWLMYATSNTTFCRDMSLTYLKRSSAESLKEIPSTALPSFATLWSTLPRPPRLATMLGLSASGPWMLKTHWLQQSEIFQSEEYLYAQSIHRVTYKLSLPTSAECRPQTSLEPSLHHS